MQGKAEAQDMSLDPAAAAGSADPSSVDPGEVEKFARLARDWWDPKGPMAPLHRMNPARLAFVRDRLAADPRALRPLAGLRLLDLGCGAGLLSEPLARMGATVVGADASAGALAVARDHAAAQGLAIDYRETTAEALQAAGESFDAVLALEVVEHVADPAAFLASACALVRPEGQLLLSTLNRTAKAFLMAIVGAEWVLRLLPRGTHEWRRFITPAEMKRLLRAQGFEIAAQKGLVLNPLDRSWRLSDRDLEVNYLMAAARAPAPDAPGPAGRPG
jgi:2-polyprenyl-6-hydroxyphenyl methylase/3-demethylubiquinone-9 3-methyltransferase